MRNGKTDIMSIIAAITTILIIVLVMTVNSGCAAKPTIITKYKYIEKQCPLLTVYDGCDVNITLTAFNKNDKVCVKEWGGCIDKKAFVKLVKYINKIKSTCEKYNTEIILYNESQKKQKN